MAGEVYDRSIHIAGLEKLPEIRRHARAGVEKILKDTQYSKECEIAIYLVRATEYHYDTE